MSSSYPGAIDSYTTKTDSVDTVAAAHVNNLQDAVVAIETELGTNPKGSYTSVGAGLADKVSKAGDTMSGDLDMNTNTVTGLGAPSADDDAATKEYVDDLAGPTALIWKDDFTGDKDARWTLSGTGGTYAQNSELGGTGDLSTGATTDNEAVLSFNANRCTDKTKDPFVLARAKLNSTTQVLSILAGLFYDSDNFIGIDYDVTDTAGNFKYRCKSGGTETVEDSGLAADTSYHVFEFRVTGGGSSVSFLIDGANVEEISTNIPSSLLEPRVSVKTKETSDKRLTIDFYYLRASR